MCLSEDKLPPTSSCSHPPDFCSSLGVSVICAFFFYLLPLRWRFCAYVFYFSPGHFTQTPAQHLAFTEGLPGAGLSPAWVSEDHCSGFSCTLQPGQGPLSAVPTLIWGIYTCFRGKSSGLGIALDLASLQRLLQE